MYGYAGERALDPGGTGRQQQWFAVRRGEGEWLVDAALGPPSADHFVAGEQLQRSGGVDDVQDRHGGLGPREAGVAFGAQHDHVLRRDLTTVLQPMPGPLLGTQPAARAAVVAPGRG